MRLPELSNETPNTRVSESTRQTDRQHKQKMKEYADRKNQASSARIMIGDRVLVCRPRLNKLTSYHDPNPYTVSKIKGSMITATRPNHEITRNSSHFNRIQRDVTHQEKEHGQEEDDLDYIPFSNKTIRPNKRPTSAAPPER